MNIQKFKEFVETVDYIKQLNNVSNLKFVYIKKDRFAIFRDFLSPSDVVGISGILFIEKYYTQYGKNTNSHGRYIGMCDSNLDFISELYINESWYLVNMRFENGPGWYDDLMPIACLKNKNTQKELEIKVEWESWETLFPKLFKKILYATV